MGLCILFPALCGLKTKKVIEMKQICSGVINDLEQELSFYDEIAKREFLIDVYRAKALEMLRKKGYNPYE